MHAVFLLLDGGDGTGEPGDGRTDIKTTTTATTATTATATTLCM